MNTVWWQQKKILAIIIALAGVVVLLVGPRIRAANKGATQDVNVAFLQSAAPPPEDTFSRIDATPILTAEAALPETVAIVHVTGAVAQPDVYTISSEARVKDVVVAAGGLTDEAASEDINLAAPITDGQKIHVPRLGEQTTPPSSVAVAPDATLSARSAGQININTASAIVLEELPGIGERLSERIVTYRTVEGPFAAIEDIQNVSGIGAKQLAEISPLITVGE